MESDYNISEIIKLISKKKKSILLISFIFSLIIGFIVFFILDPIFLSTGTVKTASSESGISSLISSSGLPGIGDLEDLTGGSTGKELALYQSILNSRRCVDAAIIKFNLLEEWDVKYMQDAVKIFRDNVMKVEKERFSGTLEIGVYDKSPQRAKDIADFLITQLNIINTELNVQNAKNNREFIETRYNLVKNDLKNKEDSLKFFQDTYGISPELTLQAAVKSQIELEAEIKSEEVKLDILNTMLSQDQPEVKIQSDKIHLLKNQLEKIKNTNVNEGFLNLKGSPQVLLDYLRLKRDVEIQNKILTTIIPLLEQSKIQENKLTPSVLILDPPQVPERKVKPKRLTITVISFFLSMLTCITYYIAKDKWTKYKISSNFVNS